VLSVTQTECVCVSGVAVLVLVVSIVSVTAAFLSPVDHRVRLSRRERCVLLVLLTLSPGLNVSACRCSALGLVMLLLVSVNFVMAVICRSHIRVLTHAFRSLPL
jgi:hypothetical protein